MKKKLLLLLAALTVIATAFVITGCGGDEEKADWDYIEENGKIIIDSICGIDNDMSFGDLTYNDIMEGLEAFLDFLPILLYLT